MTRGSRQKNKNKRRKSTMVSPSNKIAEANLRLDRTVITSKKVFIAAPEESCFGILANQLEYPCKWDLMIVNTKPVSNNRGRGATSQVTLNLGGKQLESLAVIFRYDPNRTISWVFTTRPKVMEGWQLKPKRRGTVVRVTLAHELNGWGIGRLLYRVMRRRKVEQGLDKMLAQLKVVVEGINQSQRVGS